MSVNITVVPAMPSPNVRMAAALKDFARRNPRAARRTSCWRVSKIMRTGSWTVSHDMRRLENCHSLSFCKHEACGGDWADAPHRE
jgi:hypothetical protein